MSLITYIFRRLLLLIPILFGTLFITFVLTHLMPGNPYMAGLSHGSLSQQEVYHENVERLGLDKPIITQFWMYLVSLFQGNWGNSIVLSKGTSVWTMIWQAFPHTFELAFFSELIAAIIGIRIGVISAINRNKLKDNIIRTIALIGVAIPVFWLGLILQYTLGYKLGILPVGGYKTVYFGDPTTITGLRLIDSLIQGIITGDWSLFTDTVVHLILPVFVLSFAEVGFIARYTRSSMLEVLELDYIRTARAKGCKESDVINKHALRNALIPTVTVIGINFGALLGGAVLTETTFNFRGMGMLMIQAIAAIDYNVMIAAVFVVTLLFIIVNLITDILYGIIDPRIRY